MSNKNEQLENNKKSGISKLFSHTEGSDSNDEGYGSLPKFPLNESLFDTAEQEKVTVQASSEKPETSEKQEAEASEQSENAPLYVEKEEVDIDSSASTLDKAEVTKDSDASQSKKSGDNNSTTIFTFAKDLPEGTEISHEELSVSELEDSAKSYFNATHTDSIDDKVTELCKLAGSGFEGEDEEEESVAATSSEQGAGKQKKKKRGIISDDDMEILSRMKDDDDAESYDEENKDDIDELDKNLRIAFGMEGGKESEEFGKKYEHMLSDDEPDMEYTEHAQEALISKGLRTNAIKSMLSCLLTLIVTLVCVYFEGAAGTAKAHPAFLEPGRYGLVYSMCMLQLMFFGVIFNFDGIVRGFKGLNPHRASAEGLAVGTVIICAVQAIGSSLIAGNSTELHTYCSVGLVSLLLLSINSFIKAYTKFGSFGVVASKKPKFSTTELDATSQEAASFAKYLEKDTTIFTIGKSDFIEGFFKKSCAAPVSGRFSFRMFVTAIVGGIIVGILSGIFSGELYRGFSTGCVVALATIPANMLIATSLPFMLSSLRVRRSRTAFLGEAACDSYTTAEILSFDDTEVFPPKAVKVSSIRTFGDNRIDKVIVNMASLFNKLGGPLSFVFANSVQDSAENISEAHIVEHAVDGLRAKIDDKDIMLGTSSFMKFYDIATPSDNIDESFLQSLGSILYMTVGGELAAKFYIKYTINKNFEGILRSLYDSGICVGVKSLDPCINNQLICGNLKGSNYPVSVIKKTDSAESANEILPSSDGSVVSLSGVHSFLKGFIQLDALRNVYRSNAIIARFCSVIGLIVSAAITLTGAVPMPGISFLIIFQLLWCLPTIVFSALGK